MTLENGQTSGNDNNDSSDNDSENGSENNSENGSGNKENEAPATGDSAVRIYVYGALMVLALTAAVIVFRKKEEICER